MNAIIGLLETHKRRFQNGEITLSQMWEAITNDLDTIIHEEESQETPELNQTENISLYATA